MTTETQKIGPLTEIIASSLVGSLAGQLSRLSAVNMAALPEELLCEIYDLPLSTYRQLKGEGRGPRTFKIGRRCYVHQKDAAAWFDALREASNS